MKTTSSLVKGLLVGAIALASVCALSAQTRAETAKVIRVKGAARFMVAGGAWQEIRVGTILEPGSVVQSDIEGSSFVDILLGKGAGGFGGMGAGASGSGAGAGGGYTASTKATVVHLFSNTVLGLDKLQVTETGAGAVADTELDLRQGRIVANVKKLTAGSDFRVRYPKGVGRVHGSVLDMNVGKSDAGDQSQVTFGMALGTGEITYNGTGYTVPPGQQFQSGPPPAVVPMSSQATGDILAIAFQATAQPTAITHLPDPGQTEVQFVTGTGGPPPKPAVRPE